MLHFNVVSQLFRHGNEKLLLSLPFALKPAENVSERAAVREKKRRVVHRVHEAVYTQTFLSISNDSMQS